MKYGLRSLIVITMLFSFSTTHSRQNTSSNEMTSPFSNYKKSTSNVNGAEPWMITWLKHWNIGFGTTISSDIHISSTTFDKSVSFQDGYNDTYRFQWSINEYNGNPTQSHFTLRLPLYFNNKSSTGLFFYRRGFGAGILKGEDYTSKPKNQNLGIFYSRQITPKLKTTFSIGTANYELGATIGSLKSAWSGDPGYYHENDEKFIDIGTDMFLSGFSDSYTTYVVDVAYMIWGAIFAELHFSTHGKGGSISQFDYELGEYSDFGSITLDNPVTIDDSFVISIGIGIGY
jgi:hypothetical protein